jgi:hypothetical protein
LPDINEKEAVHFILVKRPLSYNFIGKCQLLSLGC